MLRWVMSKILVKTGRFTSDGIEVGTARSKRDGTRAETRFGLSAKRTSPFKLAGCQFSRLLAAEECASAVSDCIDRVPTYSARLLATHSIRIFPLHFPTRASPCAIRFRTRYTAEPGPKTLFVQPCLSLGTQPKYGVVYFIFRIIAV